MSISIQRRELNSQPSDCESPPSRHSLVDSSMPSFLPPRVWVPSTPSTLLSIYIDLFLVEKTKINKKGPGLVNFLEENKSCSLKCVHKSLGTKKAWKAIFPEIIQTSIFDWGMLYYFDRDILTTDTINFFQLTKF